MNLPPDWRCPLKEESEVERLLFLGEYLPLKGNILSSGKQLKGGLLILAFPFLVALGASFWSTCPLSQ